MNRTTAIGIGVGALVILLLVTLTGRNQGEVPTLDSEPTVNLIDKESGEQRQLSMEEYISGVVAGEMGQLPSEVDSEQDWPREAYAAQAIIARSFALTFLSEEGTINISTDVEEAQAYAPEKITPAIEEAVRETRGVVMAHSGNFIHAWFHSYSGGHTATAKEGLNYQKSEPPFIRAREVVENEYVPKRLQGWSTTIPLAQVNAGLAERGVNVGELQQVDVTEWGQSGRASKLTLTGSAGAQEMHAADFRVAVGSEELKSTKLETLAVQGDQLVASGTGFGHGVGLSQWDAYKLAKDGRSARDILEYFFQDITIGKAWE